MNKIGLWGLGNISTLHYINRLNTQYLEIKKGYSTFPFELVNSDFNEINPYLPFHFENLMPPIEKVFKRFDSFKISHLLIPNISLHAAVDQCLKSSDFCFKIIHPFDLLKHHLENLKEVNFSIIGTKYTCNSGYVYDFLKHNCGLPLQMSNEAVQSFENLRNSAYTSITQENITKFSEIYENLPQDRKYVIACTELSALASHKQIKGIIDLAELQIKSAIQLSL
jgi:aspartate racemase